MAAGLSNGYVNNISKGIGADKLQRILGAYPMLNQDWLLTGEGEMVKKETPSVNDVNLDSHEPMAIPTESNAVLSMPVEEMEYVSQNSKGAMFMRDNLGRLRMSVPHVPYACRAEFANMSDRLEPNLDGWKHEIYLVDKKVRGNYLSFEVKGDSMDDGSRNSLQDGDKVLVRELEHDFWKDLHLQNHRYWVLVFGTSVLIKQIIKADSTSGEIICHSLNPSPEYADFSLNLDDVRMLYYVVKIKPREISL